MKYTIAYNHRTNDELTAFAASRNLEVTSTRPKKSPGTGPLRKDLFKALKDGDEEWAFRFMELSPEMRNRIYEELLIFRNSFTCWPAILATCKQVHKEASSILYGDNLLEIKIFPDGVYVHGAPCGTFNPSRGTCNGMAGCDFTKLKFPEFLDRAQYVRMSFGHEVSGRWLKDSLDSILYAVCSHLRGKHQLRSFEVVTRYISQTSNEIATADCNVYPVALLGQLPRFVLNEVLIPTYDGTNVTETLTDIRNALLQSMSALLESIRQLKVDLDLHTFPIYREHELHKLILKIFDTVLAMRSELQKGNSDGLIQCIDNLRKHIDMCLWSRENATNVVAALQGIFKQEIDFMLAQGFDGQNVRWNK